MNQNIFRKVSLERLSSPEQLDQTITVISPKGWFALAATIFLVIMAIAWGFFGVISTRVYGQGILMRSRGVRNVVHESRGRITDIRVVPGDIIKPGDVIARIDSHEKVIAILEADEQLKRLGTDHVGSKEEIEETKRKIEKLREELEFNSFIVSSYSGRVIEVKMNKGDMLEPGVPVISVELLGDAVKELEAVIYIPAQKGKIISVGMEVQISPTTVKKEEYGYLLGRVISVSEHPATHQRVLSVVGNEEIVNQLMGGSTSIEIHVDLVPDWNTESGYKWTSPKGPPMRINSGTLCSASVVIQNVAPVKKVLPIKWNGKKGKSDVCF